MIAFDFDWSAPLNLVLILLLVILGGLQVGFLFRSRGTVSKQKMGVRIALNLLLWLVVVSFLLQPVLQSKVLSGNFLIAGKDVPSHEIGRIKDSLRIREVLSEGNFKANNIDTLILVGQDFGSSFYSGLAQTLPIDAKVKWIAYMSENQVQSVCWKGLLRRGQLQKISGTAKISVPQWIKVKFGNETLDSAKLENGLQSFNLVFPVFSEKRTAAELFLGDKMLGEIRFFAQPLPPMTFRFILDNPDFESRTLAAWLANQGHAVEVVTNLSKDIQSTLKINKTGNPDVIVTDPNNAGNAQIRKALAGGKRILFINLANPAADITNINASLGTRFVLKKISNEEVLPVSGELTSFPFAFGTANTYVTLPKYPVAIENVTGKVAVSLLNETFPTMLNGDSLTYRNIWTSVLAAIHPAYTTNIEIAAPVYKGISTEFQANNLTGNPGILSIGHDSVYLNYSVINKQTAHGRFIPQEAPWTTFVEGSEIAVSDSLNFIHVYQARRVSDFVNARSALQSSLADSSTLSDPGSQPVSESRLPDWIWFLMIIFCFTALWLEPKFG